MSLVGRDSETLGAADQCGMADFEDNPPLIDHKLVSNWHDQLDWGLENI